MKARRILQAALCAMGLLGAVHSQAARNFTPQAGTWVISSEVDGKPGRGLAIDVQGNMFFMQVFAYDTRGQATFYTAMGPMEGGTVTAQLVRYAGGQAFGSEERSAGFDSTPGNVTLRFTDGLHGMVELPGEMPAAIERFVVQSQAFDDLYLRPAEVPERRMRLVGVDGAGAPSQAWDARLTSAGGRGKRQLVMSRATAAGNAPTQLLECTRREGLDAYDCTAGEAGHDSVHITQASLRLTGGDVQGVLETRGDVSGRLSVVGDVVMGGIISVTGACSVGAYIYVQDLPCYSNDLKMPSNGTWMVAQEINGKPGRGIAVDVQYGLAIAQVFNYAGNGRSTFHMGSGEYEAPEASFALQRYEDGRFFGGPPSSARLVESAGDVNLGFYRLDDKTKRGLRTEGVVQFPNEAAKRMLRLNLEGEETIADRLRGQWMMRFAAVDGAGPARTLLVNLSQDRGGAIASDDGAVQCAAVQSLVSTNEVTCLWHADSGKGTLLGTASFAQQANNRSVIALRIRDRHGNSTGLGPWE